MSRASQLLRAARLQSGLTQAELADRAGMTQSVIARMESRSANPTIASLDRVLSAMNRRLELGPPRALPDIDARDIHAQWRLTPAQRLKTHDASQQNLRDLVGRARRVPR